MVKDTKSHVIIIYSSLLLTQHLQPHPKLNSFQKSISHPYGQLCPALWQTIHSSALEEE